jgi:hypothetical protein
MWGTSRSDAGTLLPVSPVLAALERLPLQQRLERLEQFLADLGEYREASGALDLSESDLRFLQSLTKGAADGISELLDAKLGNKVVMELGGQVLMSLPRMIQLYRLLSEQQPTATIEPISRRILAGIAQCIMAASYFKKFDEKHLPR